MTATDTAVRRHHHEAVPARPRAEVPRLVVVAALIVLAVNVVVMFVGAWQSGIAWDEPTHVQRLQSYFDTGWYLPDAQMVGDQPAPGVQGLYVYAPVAALFAHGVALVLGAEGLGQSSAAAEAYAARHIGIVLLALLGLVAAAGTMRLITRSWRWGLVAAAVLSAIPAWVGHAMFNIKDLPVATGYAVFTFGLVALSRPALIRSSRLRLVGAGGVAVGTTIALGTRPGMWAGLLGGALLLVSASWWFGRGQRGGVDGNAHVWAQLRGLLVGAGAAYLVLLLVYPNLFGHPGLLIDALRDSADYPWVVTVLTAGTQMPMPPGPSYLPLWFAAQTPLVIGALALVGVGGTTVLMIRALMRRGTAAETATAVALAVVACQALLLPIGAVVRHSVLYDAARQVLFVIPAMAVLAAAGAWLIEQRTRGRGPTVLRAAAWCALVLGLVVPTITHIRLFPYDYTYFNLAAESRPIDGAWMVDYWRTSGREITPWIPAGPESCVARQPVTGLWPCGSLAPLTPYWATRSAAVPGVEAGPGEYWYTVFNRDGTALPPGCTETSRVSRPLLTQSITMSLVARCVVELPAYPSDGIRTASKEAAGHLLWGWYPAQALGVWSGSRDADLGLALPPSLTGRDVRLTLVTAPYVPPGGSQTMTISVNGVQVRTSVYGDTVGAGSVVIDVPADLAWKLDGRLVVRLSVPSLVSPASVGDGKDLRPLGVVLGSVKVGSVDGAGS